MRLNSKKCKACGKFKPQEEYRRTNFGLRQTCTPCVSAKAAAARRASRLAKQRGSERAARDAHADPDLADAQAALREANGDALWTVICDGGIAAQNETLEAALTCYAGCVSRDEDAQVTLLREVAAEVVMTARLKGGES